MKASAFFKNKVVLITGGSSGIGKELASQILQYGGIVIITGRNIVTLLDAQDEFIEYSETLRIHSGDVSNYENDLELVKKIISEFNRLDVVICNAGMSSDFGDLENTSEKVVEEIIDTNIKGSIYTSRVAIPELKKSKGSLLFVSSISAFQGQSGYSLYSLSKMALTGLYQSLVIENKKAGVHVGIAYICFTENESRKRILSIDGKPAKVPKRYKILTRSRHKTARIILNQISNRKSRTIHSIFGKLIFLWSKYTPIITNVLFERVYNNIKRARAEE